MKKKEQVYVYPNLYGKLDKVLQDLRESVEKVVPEECRESCGVLVGGDDCVQVTWERPMTESEVLEKRQSDAAYRERRIKHHKEELRKLESN